MLKTTQLQHRFIWDYCTLPYDPNILPKFSNYFQSYIFIKAFPNKSVLCDIGAVYLIFFHIGINSANTFFISHLPEPSLLFNIKSENQHVHSIGRLMCISSSMSSPSPVLSQVQPYTIAPLPIYRKYIPSSAFRPMKWCWGTVEHCR